MQQPDIAEAALAETVMRTLDDGKALLASEVRTALMSGQFVPYYQPKYCVSTGALSGFEALARWQHPDSGLLNPEHFGAFFADPDISPLIGRCIRQHVVQNVREWLDQGFDPGKVAINLAPGELTSPRLGEEILELLDDWSVPVANLEAEVTETVILGGASIHVSETLEHLADRGIQIAFDDFGTGYASLTHLKRFPVKHIKVDRSFVQDLEDDGIDHAIVEAVIGLGRNLGLHVTAEGVETTEQLSRLKQMNCPSAQGFLFARPMPADQILPLLAAEADGCGVGKRISGS